MRSFRFWRLLEERLEVGGRWWRLRAWGGSNEGVAAATRAAEQRLRELRASAQRERGLLTQYEYGTHALREEWLQLVQGTEEAPEALVTRNRYGAPVLNARALGMFDVDLPEPSELRKFLFWRRPPPSPEVEALERLRAFAAANPRLSLRLYRTPAGLRVLRCDAEMAPDSPETARFMEAFRADPLYEQLCRKQRCFRARLGPKPWRVGLAAPPATYPREGGAVEAFERWLGRYEAAARDVAACRFLEALGPARIAPSLAKLVTLHDEQSGALRELPLA